MPTDAQAAIAVLRNLHENLVGITGKLSAEDVRRPSYADEWTIAQVLSHLGSGSVINKLNLDLALAGRPAPDQEEYLAIWDTWNAKSPDEQAADMVEADRVLVETYEGMDESQLTTVRVPFAGMQLDVVGAARLRIAEHAIHTWDVAVMLDDSATVDAAAIEQIVDLTPRVAGWAGKPSGENVAVQLTMDNPVRSFTLTSTDAVILEPGTNPALPVVDLPAEAFVRLVYGRLDAAHTPEIARGEEFLPSLRAIFPGF
jgi:uncharacterized protein (TIGR03083 family)